MGLLVVTFAVSLLFVYCHIDSVGIWFPEFLGRSLWGEGQNWLSFFFFFEIFEHFLWYRWNLNMPVLVYRCAWLVCLIGIVERRAASQFLIVKIRRSPLTGGQTVEPSCHVKLASPKR